MTGRSPVHVVHIFGRMDVGGAELRTLELLRQMTPMGFQFTFITLSGERGTLADQIEELGGEVKPMRLDVAFPLRFASFLLKRKPRALDSHVATFSGALCLIAKWCGVPVRIAHFHSDGDGHPNGVWRIRQRRIMVRLIQLSATSVVGVSPSALSSGFRSDWSDLPRCALLPNGTDSARLWRSPAVDLRDAIGIRHGTVLVLHVGRPSPEKNRARIPGILSALRERGVDAHVAYLGPRDDFDEGEVLAESIRLDIADRVHFLGPSEEVGAYMRGADVLVLPSLREGLPGAVVEACAVGTPVVASTVGGAVWLAGQLPGIRCVNLSEPDEVWAETVEIAIGEPLDPATSRALVDASPFSLVTSIERHVCLYESGRFPEIDAGDEVRDEASGTSVLVTTEAHFTRGPDGVVRTDAAQSAYHIWSQYHASADRVLVAGRVSNSNVADGMPVEGPGVSVIPIPGYSGLKGTLLSPPRTLRAVWAVAGVRDTAAVVRLPSVVGTLAVVALRLRGRSYAVELIGDPFDVLRSGIVPPRLGRPLSWVFLWVVRWQCRNAKLINYVTTSTLQRRYPSGRAAIVTNFSDVELPADAFRSPLERGMFGKPAKLVTVGTLSQIYKGHHVLFEAIGMLLSSGVDVRLRVIGDGRCLDQLQEQAKGLAILNRVEFVGQLPRARVLDEFDDADLFVLPSLTEGLPRALIEAMARGLPAIASRVGGVGELLDAQDTVQPGDAPALATKIAVMVTDTARSRAAAMRNFERAQSFAGWDPLAQRSLFYQRLGELAMHGDIA